MNHGEITEKIFDFADDLVGHWNGGLAQVNIITSLIFSGISGSALADIGGVGRVLIHSMKKEGYSPEFSAALTSTSATVGPIFPPSIPLVIFGIIAQVSVTQLLIAGAGPAILVTLLLMIWTAYLAYVNDHPSNDTRTNIRKIAQSFLLSLPAMFTPVVLIAGMLGGYFSPTEAAGVTVFYILLINTIVYRYTKLGYIWTSSIETVRTTGSIVLILAAAGAFSWVASVESLDTLFAGFILSISENQVIVLLLIIILLLFFGLFLDPLAGLIMLTPIVHPIMVNVGIDPVQSGIVITFSLMIGLLTPPLGLSMYLSADIADADIGSVMREMKGFYLIMIIALLILTFVPSITLILVEMFIR